MKPYYSNEAAGVVLYHGRAEDVLPGLSANSINGVITDPPYGTTACSWDTIIPFDVMWEQLKRITERRGAIVLFGSQPFTSALIMSNPAMFRYEWIWAKSRPTQFLDAQRKPLKAHENILIFSSAAPCYYPQKDKGEPNHTVKGRPADSTTNNLYSAYSRIEEKQTPEKYPRSVVRFNSLDPCKQIHPTQKPLDLMEYLVRTYSNTDETVLDFTAGSGTTGLACLRLGRKFIGIERDRDYCEIAARRIQTEIEKGTLFDPRELEAAPRQLEMTVGATDH